jgi:hypothetical protein
MTNILPANIDKHFEVLEDPKTGDYERYHLICRYMDGTKQKDYRRQWKLTGTELAALPADIADANSLRRHRKVEEIQALKKQIQTDLERQGRRLIVSGDGQLRMQD